MGARTLDEANTNTGDPLDLVHIDDGRLADGATAWRTAPRPRALQIDSPDRFPALLLCNAAQTGTNERVTL
jgi:hypothetical protein